MKNKIRELKGDEEDDEPFRPIDVDAILRREGSTYEDGSTEENGDTVPAPIGYQAGLYPPNYPYVNAHGNGIPRQEFRKGCEDHTLPDYDEYANDNAQGINSPFFLRETPRHVVPPTVVAQHEHAQRHPRSYRVCSRVEAAPSWRTDPELWFIQVEAQFAARHITADLTRYHHIVSSLPPATAGELCDSLLAPPAENAYQTMKETLLPCLPPSELERLLQLLDDTDLGDHTPSQLLRYMRRLAGIVTGLDSSLLREVFLQRLPKSMHVALATVAQKDIGKLATIADTIKKAANPSVSIANVQVESASDLPPNEFLELREEIARLTDTVAALQARRSRPLKQRIAPPQQP
ncbi:hypothetical protein HPB49_024114 [Dermacentor silvarum]|uniref:Uncharacterized protein n=1 Tax=Dermacentor silvarum TaxID=543639 RepID=A0ACB8D955_DERSI|nr:hypothetical protein HPB49_024114 [Dermacentor silvarum]